jgi:hypothetical protein
MPGNKSFQTYSPRVRAFHYDALVLNSGCQDLVPGNDWSLSKAFNRICIFPHSASSPIFNQPETVAYTFGPATTGGDKPWDTRWAAWVGKNGIRVGKLAYVLPGSSAGSSSTLFPTSKPTKLALGFLTNGLMAIAIQKNEESIQIKWFKDDSGDVDSIGDVSFVGQSPVLFQNGLIAITDSESEEEENDLALYYLRSSEPRKIFLRLERDNFAIERIVNDKVQTDLTTLKSTEKEGYKQLLYARDEFERDVTFYSPDYAIMVDGDEADLDISFERGVYVETAVSVDAGTEEATLSLAITDGVYNAPIVDAGTLTGDAGTLTLSFSAGEYN